MSYLDGLRLHFVGRFQAAVSTVNNDPTHYDTAAFDPRFQQRPEGAWNPRGSADWRLVGCRVTAAAHRDGRPAAPDDPIRSCLVVDSDRAAPAKLVDLDTQQQLASQVWGLEVRVCGPDGRALMRGAFEPVAFTDLWQRSRQGGEDFPLGAMYQSVLVGVEWGDVDASPFLAELRDAADVLSIKFNVDGYDMDFRSPDFTLGRIAGTLGPATPREPRHFIAGRQLMAAAQGFNPCQAVVDAEHGKVHLDVGNALPTTVPGGPPADVGTLTLACLAPQRVELGEVGYRDDDWYETTAGVVTLPASRRLTQDELVTIGAHPLALLVEASGQAPAPAVAEPDSGVHVRADEQVLRLDPGDTAHVRLFATRFGRPHARATVRLLRDDGQLQGGNGTPDVGTPPGAIQVPPRTVTDADGLAGFDVVARDPGNPRDFIDGQVYGVRPVLEETLQPGSPYPHNPWNFVSVLVWDAVAPEHPRAWNGTIGPIFRQYANLYPVMDTFLDLGDYESVCAHRELLLLAYGLPASDPNSMPVTRDLSRGKRDAILAWLRAPAADGKPLLGAPAPEAAQPRPAAMPAAEGAAAEGTAMRGGKAAALERRLDPEPRVA